MSKMTKERALPDFEQAMIAFLPDESDRSFIFSHVQNAFDGVEADLMDPAMYHVTIANLGPLTTKDAARIQREFRWTGPRRVSGKLGGAGYFTPEGEESKVLVALFDSPHIRNMKNFVDTYLIDAGFPVSSNHGFTPHITLARGNDLSPLAKLDFQNQDVIFDRLYLVIDDFKIPLGYDDTEELREKPVEAFPMKSYELSPEGDLWIYVYGLPFEGPEYLDGKDLHEEYFSDKTDIGPLEKVLSYWDHGKISDDPLYKKVGEYFGKDPLGIAERIAKDDEGWIYRVIVDRRKKYFELLKRLAEERLLGASSTPFQRGVQKSADGHWDKWPIVEVALTPTPANPDAEQYLSKSLAEILGVDMANKGQDREKNADLDAPEEATTEEEVLETEGTESLADQIGKVFESEESDDENDEENAEEEMTLAKAIGELNSKIDRLIEVVESNNEQVEKDLGDVKTAFPELARHIKQIVGVGVKRSGQSQAEKDAEEIVREKNTNNSRSARVSYLPPDAPGLH